MSTVPSDPSKILEFIGTTKNPKLKKIRNLNPEFSSIPGAIRRGEMNPRGSLEKNKTLSDILDIYMNEAGSDVDWMYDLDDPTEVANAEKAVKQAALEHLRDYIKDNIEFAGPENINPRIATGDIRYRVNPFRPNSLVKDR